MKIKLVRADRCLGCYIKVTKKNSWDYKREHCYTCGRLKEITKTVADIYLMLEKKEK